MGMVRNVITMNLFWQKIIQTQFPIMVSSYNDDYLDLKIKKGEFYTEIHELNGLEFVHQKKK